MIAGMQMKKRRSWSGCQDPQLKKIMNQTGKIRSYLKKTTDQKKSNISSCQSFLKITKASHPLAGAAAIDPSFNFSTILLVIYSE